MISPRRSPLSLAACAVYLVAAACSSPQGSSHRDPEGSGGADGTATGGATGAQSGGGPSSTGGTSATSGGTSGESSGGQASGGQATGGSDGTSCLDAFGTTAFYQTAPSGLMWASEYWSGQAHEVPFGSPDPADPGALANRRGTGTVTVNGDGTLSMTGSQPRIYLGTTSSHPWHNTEITVYYQRIEDDNTAFAGLVVGARSGPDGHGTDNCTATTYYARIRHDGRIDLAKELEHPTALARETKYIWPSDAPLPSGQWIGMKYIVYNDEQSGVRLLVYRDLTEGENGGDWELLVDSTDNGGWAPTHTCDFEADHIIREGGGVVFIRNTGLTGPGALYRNLTVREIDPSAPCL
jgi:hypothetical protein